MEPVKVVTCIDFEKGWNGFQASQGVYFYPRNVHIAKGTRFGHSAYFNGRSATLEVPRFTNTYRYDSRVIRLSQSNRHRSWKLVLHCENARGCAVSKWGVSVPGFLYSNNVLKCIEGIIGWRLINSDATLTHM